MELTLYQVDAFASRRFAGNPAGVVPLAAWLPDATMQAIAAENNVAETAFFVPDGEDYRLRWFTPAIEVDLCGHATLAAGFIVMTRLAPARTAVRFHSKSGPLSVARVGGMFALDFPSQPPKPVDMPQRFIDALGQKPGQILAAEKYLAVYDSEAEVAALKPDMAVLAEIDRDGVIATAPAGTANTGVDFVSRYFAPHAGIPEDPATGSAHCTLTPYWARRLGKRQLRGRQISARVGEFLCEDRGERVGIAGEAHLYLEGRIHV
jgi:PhzF family phenazine biosynthesis protein